jgi:hypothetical protein
MILGTLSELLTIQEVMKIQPALLHFFKKGNRETGKTSGAKCAMNMVFQGGMPVIIALIERHPALYVL